MEIPEIAPSLTARSYKSPNVEGGEDVVIVSGFDWTQSGAMPIEEQSPTLRVGSTIGIPSPPAVLTTQVRRLTPTECERLQGFPDGWTQSQSDTQRYRQMGNAVAVPVAEWIMRRLNLL